MTSVLKDESVALFDCEGLMAASVAASRMRKTGGAGFLSAEAIEALALGPSDGGESCLEEAAAARTSSLASRRSTRDPTVRSRRSNL